MPGFDLTFSAPKSVSVLYGVGDAALRDVIRRAHETAVRDGLGYLEREAAVARRGPGGIVSVRDADSWARRFGIGPRGLAIRSFTRTSSSPTSCRPMTVVRSLGLEQEHACGADRDVIPIASIGLLVVNTAPTFAT